MPLNLGTAVNSDDTVVRIGGERLEQVAHRAFGVSIRPDHAA